jgi:DNA-binding XRE family transcriptional regulator
MNMNLKKNKQELVYFDDWLKERLKNPKFRMGYDQARLAVRLGFKIHLLRKRLRLTQSQLAKRMGTQQQAIARLESGEYQGFTLKTLGKVAEAMGLELVIDLKSKRRKAM